MENVPRTRTKDYYAILGLRRGASAAEIKSAFRRLSFEIHPDHNPSPDANRRMAELVEARDVLTDPARRERYDIEIRAYSGGPKAPTAMGERRREAARKPPEPPAFRKPPSEGAGSIQPERLPDWYEFLGLRVTASSAEIIAALRKMQSHLNTANYSESDDTTLRRQVRLAAEALMTPAGRAIYDAAMAGTPPPAGRYPHLHENWYTFLGLSRKASGERIAARVTDLSEGLRPNSPELRAVYDAWRVLRDPALRAEYDATLAGESGRA